MNATTLLQHFDRFSEAPEAVARLRRFILDLAVRGKLVAQDPADEPAAELLKRIRAEKARKKAIILPGAAPELLYKLPQGWGVARFGDLFSLEYGDNLPAEKRSNTGEYPVYGSNGVVGSHFESFVHSPCIVIGRKGSAGALNLSLTDGCCVTDVAYYCVPPIGLDLLYSFKMFHALGLDKLGKGVKPGLSRNEAYVLPITIPPLAEQHRIVAKVDELMALCDQLQTAQDERERRRDRLVAASLHRLGTAEPESVPAAARFHLNHLARLTTHPEHIKHLRQSILNLAVRGRLVPQDPNDEPASLPLTACDERPAGIPATWIYTRLTNLLAEDTRNGYSRRPDDAPDGTPILRISAGTIRRDGVVAEEEHKLISGIDPEARLQYGLTAGDLLACRFNGNKAFVGRLTIFNDYLGIQPIYPDKLIRVRVAPRVAMSAFLQLAGDTDIVRNEVEAACATTVGNWGISASKLKEIRFQVLTKRAERMKTLSRILPWPDNVWMGVTVESTDYRQRIDLLRQTDAAVKFLSVEPLLSSMPELNLSGINWVIVGGESGPGARPMQKEWVDDICSQCRRQAIPFFFKQWGGINKKSAGRLLHGRTYDETPLFPRRELQSTPCR